MNQANQQNNAAVAATANSETDSATSQATATGAVVTQRDARRIVRQPRHYVNGTCFSSTHEFAETISTSLFHAQASVRQLKDAVGQLNEGGYVNWLEARQRAAGRVSSMDHLAGQPDVLAQEKKARQDWLRFAYRGWQLRAISDIQRLQHQLTEAKKYKGTLKGKEIFEFNQAFSQKLRLDPSMYFPFEPNLVHDVTGDRAARSTTDLYRQCLQNSSTTWTLADAVPQLTSGANSERIDLLYYPFIDHVEASYLVTLSSGAYLREEFDTLFGPRDIGSNPYIFDVALERGKVDKHVVARFYYAEERFSAVMRFVREAKEFIAEHKRSQSQSMNGLERIIAEHNFVAATVLVQQVEWLSKARADFRENQLPKWIAREEGRMQEEYEKAAGSWDSRMDAILKDIGTYHKGGFTFTRTKKH